VRVSATVLIAEDDPVFRYALCKMLSIAGYNVLVAANGREALEIAGNHTGVINLLCTDVEMPPGIDGLELGRRLIAQRPEIKMLYLTGGQMETASLLRKPFTSEELIAKVHQVLQPPFDQG
jgi:CheY-like chemotaxis protein